MHNSYISAEKFMLYASFLKFNGVSCLKVGKNIVSAFLQRDMHIIYICVYMYFFFSTEGYAYHILYLFFESNGFFPMITSRFMGIDCMPLYRKYGVRSPSHLHMSAFPSDGTLCTAGALGLLPEYSYCVPLLKKNRIFHVKYQAWNVRIFQWNMPRRMRHDWVTPIIWVFS